ncbi:transport protein [Thermoplasmatales archaeon]|nr:transport protein [Thermoplasmatales archaeon]
MIIIVWIIIMVAAIPALMGYSSLISYSNTGPSNSSTESAMASSILKNVSSSNQSLIILVQGDPYSSGVANISLGLQSTLSASSINNFTGSDSPFSSYSNYINSIALADKADIVDTNTNLTIASTRIFGFPQAFFLNWSEYGFTRSNITHSAQIAGYNNSQYERSFLNSLNETMANTSSLTYSSALSAVSNAVNSSVSSLYGQNVYILAVAKYLTVLNFTENPAFITASIISQYSGTSVSTEMVNSILVSLNPGEYYLKNYGLSGIPKFLASNYISPDSKYFIIDVNFNSPSSYLDKNGSSPSQSATPFVSAVAKQFFGSNASVTGLGAISYQTQQVTSSSGFAFALIFVVLAIAVFITLVSYKASILSLVMVSIATALGYISIYITGTLFHPVNYVVNYTLTAVILGVSTDYLVFILSRFRQELREGKDQESALEIAVSRAGKAVLISGITVSASLLMFAVFPGFRTWGIVLSLAIILTVIMEVTLLPAIMKFLGPKIFMKSGMKPLSTGYHQNSLFYRTTKAATKHKLAVVGIILILAAPAVYTVLTAQTTYNFDTGLPQGLSSVKALNQIDSSFGSNKLYPIDIIVTLGTNSSGKLTAGDLSSLQKAASIINSTEGIQGAAGPYFNNLTSAAQFTSFIVDNGKYAYFIAYSSYTPYSQHAINSVNALRSNPSLIVGGLTSQVIDQKNQNSVTYTELGILIVAVISLVLFISFRSIKYSIISVSGSLISISWTATIVYFISGYFLHQSLIYLIPIILFVILMSLGNDYTVFIISRVREELSSGGDLNEGISRGMVGSGKVVTSLGLILAASLGVLALIPSGFLEQLGIAFIISLVLDTFVIRVFYFPAMVSLMFGKKSIDKNRLKFKS